MSLALPTQPSRLKGHALLAPAGHYRRNHVGPIYRCKCGEIVYDNRSGERNGTAWARILYRDHLADVVARRDTDG